jgi:hypothetical protein
MMSYMTMIYIDDDGDARQTGAGAAMETNAETWAAFNRHRAAGVPKGSARFLLDYYNAKGDLVDTILLDAAAFEAITGEKVKTDLEYRKIDEKYWSDARASYAAKRAA